MNRQPKWNNNVGVRPFTPDEDPRDFPTLDIAEFAGDDFKPEIYIQKALANATQDDVRAFLDSLRESKELASIDLQRNVYKNYNEFVTISKEISNILKSDMLVLRGLLNKLQVVSDNLRDDTSSVTSESIVNRGRKPTTNNASDMQSIWKAQIQALWDGVEGAQNFVPLEPGRHIIRECSNFVEISMNTNKPKHAVHLFLLNDCLLIAVKKKRQATKDTTKIKLVADRCWSLDDVSLIDMKDTDEEKKNLMNMTKRATDEMIGRNALPSSLRNQKNSSPKISAKSPRELSFNDLREIEDLADRLDVQIATREFDEAVESIEKALTNVSADPTRLDSIRVKMEDRVVRLSYAISRDLTNPNVKKTQVQKCVKWLLRLGYGEQAREQFLSARTNNIRIRTKQLKFEGDIPQYINELSLVHFTLIKNTCDWYSAAFKDIKMASGLVKWAKEEVEHYASMFQRQVYSPHNRDDKIVRKCLKYARDHCLMLREVGLDLKFLLDTLLQLDASSVNTNGISNAANNTVYESLSGLTEEEEDLLDSYGA
ncbi:Cullin repeat-like-containing domain protein [Gigaspora rosea]|uniref:Exocyst complex component EXO84 n=1 Tax=Gigaspora rosea TaxID=44941 RepID=A0A397V5A3_9GLOM|nr:Cullin repeat-like-containing domain protein [Gigaspora rosea]